jgi:hypothetical protein
MGSTGVLETMADLKPEDGALPVDLSIFQHKADVSSSLMPLRRSTRKVIAPVKADEIPLASFYDGVHLKRSRASSMKSEIDHSERPNRSPKKKRSYAAPETYAHLNGLQDWLKDDLDGK